MRFALSQEQLDFAASIDACLTDTGPKGLAELGVPALLVPERFDGLDASAIDLVVAFDQLGYHATPGPWVDTVAVLPALLDDEILASVAAGETLASIVYRPHVPYALDADTAEAKLFVDGAALRTFTAGRMLSSVDKSRRLFEVEPGEVIGAAADTARAFELGALATTAQLLGLGRWLLDTSVAYAKQRKQYGREIGQYQAIKHLLADVVTRLELAKPLLYAAALSLLPRDVSAAKVAVADAAHLAARTGLQVHGAIGYTAEHPLGARLTKVRALVAAWGTQGFHRARVLESL
ncbi:acyl-CoA dehydrogenase family protein [Amycolatopsis sp. NPDC059657]|uniref:acyl-CoA dehydrogenase family protein n=1 Tax=Amycolatopsis sp. NPDC059657 TaxID=3346899 RepID=UPI00366AA13B